MPPPPACDIKPNFYSLCLSSRPFLALKFVNYFLSVLYFDIDLGLVRIKKIQFIKMNDLHLPIIFFSNATIELERFTLH